MRCARSRNSWVALGLIFILNCVNTHAEFEASIMNRIQHAFVELEMPIGNGPGILLHPEGWVLTSRFWVSGLHEIVIEAVGYDGENWEKKKYGANLISIHPQYNLALVKIENQQDRFVHFPTESLPPPENADSVKIANYHRGELVWKEGLVSSGSREMDGLEYIQIGLDVSPFWSGAPVFSQDGSCVGLLDFKLLDGDGIGFAIPLGKIDLQTFIPLDRFEKNPHSASELYREVERLAAEAEGNAALIQEITRLFYMYALLHDPDHAIIHRKLAILYGELKYHQAAIDHWQYILSKDPETREGKIKMAENLLALNHKEKAETLLEDVVFDTAASPLERGEAAHALARLLGVTEVNPRALYFLLYAKPLVEFSQEEREFLEKAHENLPLSARILIGNCEVSDLSRQQLEEFMSLASNAVPEPLLDLSTYGLAPEQPKMYPMPTASPMELDAPVDTIGPIKPIAGGRMVAILNPRSNRLHLFDIITGKEVTQISCVEDEPERTHHGGPRIIFAGGGQLLLSWDQQLKTFKLFHAFSGELLAQKVFNNFACEEIFMGIYNPRMALVIYRKGRETRFAWLDVASLHLHKLPVADQPDELEAVWNFELPALSVDGYLNYLIFERCLFWIDRENGVLQFFSKLDPRLDKQTKRDIKFRSEYTGLSVRADWITIGGAGDICDGHGVVKTVAGNIKYQFPDLNTVATVNGNFFGILRELPGNQSKNLEYTLYSMENGQPYNSITLTHDSPSHAYMSILAIPVYNRLVALEGESKWMIHSLFNK